MARRRCLLVGYRFMENFREEGLRACLALSAPWGGLIEGEGDEWDGDAQFGSHSHAGKQNDVAIGRCSQGQFQRLYGA